MAVSLRPDRSGLVQIRPIYNPLGRLVARAAWAPRSSSRSVPALLPVDRLFGDPQKPYPLLIVLLGLADEIVVARHRRERREGGLHVSAAAVAGKRAPGLAAFL